MLVLSRKKFESLLIGEGIRITVVDIGTRRVRLAIDCSRDLTVIREELSTDRESVFDGSNA